MKIVTGPGPLAELDHDGTKIQSKKPLKMEFLLTEGNASERHDTLGLVVTD